MTGFKQAAIKELTDQQVRYAPPAKRREQVAKAEALIEELDATKNYPYQYVCFRVTDFRSDAYPDLLISGADLKRDLALFVIRVERSIPPIPVEQAQEEMLSLEEVSKRFNVSTKTVCRWRLRGLVARRIKVGGRSHLGFPKTAVEAFLNRNKERVEKGAKFCHLTDVEKDQIIANARERATAGDSLSEASRKIAAGLGRSPEAVRYTIKNYDRTHPTSAMFPQNLAGPLTAAQKQSAYVSYQEGGSVDEITKQLSRSRSSLYRVVNEGRADRLLAEPVDYMYNAEFDDASKTEEILGPMPGEEEFWNKMRGMHAPKDVDAGMAYLYSKPLLSREQEAHLFRKMNFLKHQLHQVRSKVNPSSARVQDLMEIERLSSESKRVRDLLIECNQRLVHSLATKHLSPSQTLDELKSDANLSVMRAVEKFDYSRGNKFSTYATWAVMKNFARSIPDDHVRRGRFTTGHDDLFEAKPDGRTDETEIVATADAAKNRVSHLLQYSRPPHPRSDSHANGLDGSAEMTPEQIGQHFGITKERVRQINVRGMKQLRERAAAEQVELV
ncbi:MAG: sigma-70 family RNA polymerase sigma factor [Gemmataceae bacterium]